MGAEQFESWADGKDVETAFRGAVEHAEYEYGHAGYTGTIAEKDSYVIIREAEPDGTDDPEALGEKLMEADDERISDKWGPAGAIRIKGGGWYFFGYASS